MNQTGTLSTGLHRQARKNAESATGTQATLLDRAWVPSSCWKADPRRLLT